MDERMNSGMRATAGNLLESVEKQASKMAVVEDGLERGYAHLGYMLLEVAEMQYWRVQYDTWTDYLKSVALKSKKTHGQLRQYFHTVRDLSSTFTPEQLEVIGITKAIQLRNAIDYAIVLPVAVVNAALDVTLTVKDLKKVISVALKMPEDEEGDWMDCEMEFMVTPEQRATIEQAIDVAMRTDPVTKTTISKSAQMLDVQMKLSMEFLAGHSGDGQ